MKRQTMKRQIVAVFLTLLMLVTSFIPLTVYGSSDDYPVSDNEVSAVIESIEDEFNVRIDISGLRPTFTNRQVLLHVHSVRQSLDMMSSELHNAMVSHWGTRNRRMTMQMLRW